MKMPSVYGELGMYMYEIAQMNQDIMTKHKPSLVAFGILFLVCKRILRLSRNHTQYAINLNYHDQCIQVLSERSIRDLYPMI